MQADRTSRADLTIAIAGRGRRLGHIVLPYSRNESGWGSLRIPVAIVSGVRDGPTVLLVGGNHGDEFEGPLVLNELARTLGPERLRGTVIIVPCLNYPAVKAGQRLSPIDGGNMNRAFRGRRDGTVTEQVAHFVEEAFVSRADAVLDIHAGGRSMFFHPFAAVHKLPDPAQAERALKALLAFGAPLGLVLEELDSEGMLDTAVERRGKLFLTTELGGGGSTTPHTLRVARTGVHNFLVHLGVLDDEPVAPDRPTRLMTNSGAGYVACDEAGLIEYLHELGDSVRTGETIARTFDPDHLAREPHRIVAPTDGMLLGRLHGGLAAVGDFVALIAQDL